MKIKRLKDIAHRPFIYHPASVYASVNNFIYDSTEHSVWYFIRNSVYNVVSDSVNHSVLSFVFNNLNESL